MAKRIKIGEPVNQAERWAFDYLTENLPETYLVITNLEVLAQSGQALEVDALVIGELAVYLVDVKGYIGRLEVGVNDWSLDGRWISNSLSKANYVGRVLAGRIGDRVPRGVRAPWCQGMVLVTGREGEHIEVAREYSELSVFTPGEILQGLTAPEFLTSKYKSPMSAQQRDYALDVIGKVGVMASRQNLVHDFEKKSLLGETDGFEVWEAEYHIEDWKSSWLLKVIEASKASTQEEYSRKTSAMREEFYRLQQLSGISGIPGCAPLISDGEQVVLPIKRPRGKPLSAFDVSTLQGEEAIQLIRQVVVSLQQIHGRGCTLGNLSANDVFLSDEGDLEFLEVRNDLDTQADIAHIFSLFEEIFHQTQSQPVLKTYSDATNGAVYDLEEIRLILNGALSGSVDLNQQDFEVAENNVLADRYRLVSKIEDTGSSEAWLAEHVAGEFKCVVSIYRKASENWHYVDEEFSQLIHLYHPSIERIFDFGVIEAADIYYVSRAWVEGDVLSAAGQDCNDSQLRSWLKSALRGLQYLHSQGLLHRNLSPESIICRDDDAVMVDFSGLPRQFRTSESLGFCDPLVADAGWSHESDLYSLLLSILSLSPTFEVASVPIIDHGTRGWIESNLGLETIEPIELFLSQRQTMDVGASYITHFGLDQAEDKLEELPEAFREKWGISKGYMHFLTLDMINDPVPRSRNQWVLNALRSRSIPGNKTNRSSMSATVSRLKSAGIAEDYGKKVRLTEDFKRSFRDL